MVVAVVSLISYLVIFEHEMLPVMFDYSIETTQLKDQLKNIVCIIVFFTLSVLLYQYKNQREIEMLLMIMGVFLIGIGELFFVLYGKVFDIDSVIGHTYKIFGYIFLFWAIFFPRIKQIVTGKEVAEKNV